MTFSGAPKGSRISIVISRSAEEANADSEQTVLIAVVGRDAVDETRLQRVRAVGVARLPIK
jgi:hypothetical protein